MVKKRLTRLEEFGVMLGYRLELSPRALGWPITAFVRIRPMPGQFPKIAELAVSIPQVAECHRVTGEDCFIMKVHLDALESMDSIDRFLAHGQTIRRSCNLTQCRTDRRHSWLNVDK